MKPILTFSIILFALTVTVCDARNFPLREGDIVFQSYSSAQSREIKLATRSEYSHVGMILRHNSILMVYEAVGPVKFTPVDTWIIRNDKKHFVVKRLKNADRILTVGNLADLRNVALTFKGKPYDFVFSWTDEKMYCSELVWKIFHRALNIEIGRLRKMKDFDLSSPEVRNILKDRYPSGPPLDETVVSPEDIFQSSSLTTVYKQ
jgi:uncharacterized protein YycO